MATVADVARRAGVSVSTAARVLSGHGYASDDSRRLVLSAAEELGYVPNHIARSLRTRRTKTIGLLVGDVENPFYSVIAKHVESIANTAGYHVVLCNSNDEAEAEKEYLKLLDGMRVDGLIITPTSRNLPHLRLLQRKSVVIIQMDRSVAELEADAILVDNEIGAARAVAHLLSAGHTRVGILTGPLDVPTASQRLAGYKRALKEQRIPIEPDLIRTGSFHRDHASENAVELIRAKPPPSAIFAANNLLAEGALLALASFGLKVPRDLSVVGFDDVPWMSLHPPLTTVRQPLADMARRAAELLLRRLRKDGQTPPTTMVFRSELVERASVAPPQGTS